MSERYQFFCICIKVTTQSGLDLPQSLKVLSQSKDTACPRLIKKFVDILERANASDASLRDALNDANQKARVDPVLKLMTSLSMKASTTDELVSIINAQIALANSLHQIKCRQLRKNYLRRWMPHLLFFWVFALPISVVTPLDAGSIIVSQLNSLPEPDVPLMMPSPPVFDITILERAQGMHLR